MKNGPGPVGQRLGVVVPSSNSVVEPVFNQLAVRAGEVDVYASRLKVTRVDTSAAASRQFDVSAMADAASLLADVEPSAVAWAGTAGAWLGPAHEREVVARLAQVCDAPALSSTGAVVAACQALERTRVALVTPYCSEVVELIVANLGTMGLDVLAEAHLGVTRNAEFALVQPGTLAQMAQGLVDRAPGAGAVVVLCTNLPGWPLCAGPTRADLRRLPVPVVDSVMATFWALLRSCGRDDLGPDGAWHGSEVTAGR